MMATDMSILRFIRNWTLPLAMAAGATLYFLFASIPAFDGVAQVFSRFCDTILPWFIFLVLFITFCKVDFRKLIPVKWNYCVCLFQVAFVWILVGVVLLFHLKGDQLILAEAVLTCAISPCAAAAPVVTTKLGGRLEEITTYTFMSNFLCALLIPLCFPLIEKEAHITFVTAFLCILSQACTILVLPMALAYVVKHFKPLHGFHQWVINIKDLSYYLWAVQLMILTGMTVKNIVHANTTLWFLLLIALFGLLICILQFAIGRYAGRFFDRTIESGQALGQKNTSFAIWTAFMYLAPLAAVGPGCYILWQNIINSVEIWKKRKRGELASV